MSAWYATDNVALLKLYTMRNEHLKVSEEDTCNEMLEINNENIMRYDFDAANFCSEMKNAC